MILEARCTTCGQTFNPHSDAKEDLEHVVDDNNVPCGGVGELLGHWVQPPRKFGVNLSDEALDAAINTYLGGRNPDHANRQHLRDRFRAIGEALAPHILAAIVERDGHRQWRVTGDPGPQFGLYSFVWPRRGFDENGEIEASKFMAQFSKPDRIPWPDGPHLHHRTVYIYEGDWIPDAPQEPQ